MPQPSTPTPAVPNPAPPSPAPQSQTGFNVPPIPEAPHRYPGQVPGMVREQDRTPAPEQPSTVNPAPTTQELDIAALVQKALADAKAAETPEERPQWLPASLNEFEVEKIDDPIIKSMATALKVAGKDLDLDRALGNAIARADPTLVDVAHIVEKGGPAAAQLVEIAKGIVQAIAAKSEAITQEVFSIAGGEENWTQAAAVFNSAAPQELRLTVKMMLDSAKPEYVKAGAKIVAEFGRNSGKLPDLGTQPARFAASPSTAGALTSAEFKEAIFKLDPNKPGYMDARAALFQRRAMGRRAGLK